METSNGWSLYNGLISKPYTIEGELIKAITSITVNNFRYLVKLNGLNKICMHWRINICAVLGDFLAFKYSFSKIWLFFILCVKRVKNSFST